MKCISCSEKPNIKLKDISYCKKCFEVQFIRKIKKILKNNINGNIFILNNKTLKSLILKLVLEKIFSENKKINYKIVDEIDLGGFKDILIVDECLDDVAVNVFYAFCKNSDLKNINTLPTTAKEYKIIKPFFYISYKEILYFYFIHRKNIKEWEIETIDKEKKIIFKFLDILNNKNYSTKYNIVEALRKGLDEKIKYDNNNL